MNPAEQSAAVFANALLKSFAEALEGNDGKRGAGSSARPEGNRAESNMETAGENVTGAE